MPIADILGKTVTRIDDSEGDRLEFECSDGSVYIMEHDQSCCESVDIDDIAGDLDDLVGSPIVRAEEPSSLDGFAADAKTESDQGSFTWTFYILGTTKGTVTIRWYGTSNGYYSESVSFYRKDKSWERYV